MPLLSLLVHASLLVPSQAVVAAPAAADPTVALDGPLLAALGGQRQTVAAFVWYEPSDAEQTAVGQWATGLLRHRLSAHPLITAVALFADPAQVRGLDEPSIARTAGEYQAKVTVVMSVMPPDANRRYALFFVILDGAGHELARLATAHDIPPPPGATPLPWSATPPVAQGPASPQRARAPDAVAAFKRRALLWRNEQVYRDGQPVGDAWLRDHLPEGRFADVYEEADASGRTSRLINSGVVGLWLTSCTGSGLFCCAATTGACICSPFLGRVRLSQVPFVIMLYGVIGTVLGLVGGGATATVSFLGGAPITWLVRQGVASGIERPVKPRDRKNAVTAYNQRLAEELGVQPGEVEASYFPDRL